MPDEATLAVSAMATDIYGQSSDWTPEQTVVVDSRPPTVVPDLDVPWGGLAAGPSPSGRVFRGGSLALYGAALDAAGVSSVRICAGDACAQADLQPGEAPGEQRWSFRSPALGPLDYVSRTVAISATDLVGNVTPVPLSADITIDNVAPQLSAVQTARSLLLDRPTTVLEGTVGDGGPNVAVSVRVRPPYGDVYQADAVMDSATPGTIPFSGAWHYELTGAEPGEHVLWVNATDVAGNLTSAGPLTVTVTCTDASPVTTALAAEPSASDPLTLTLRARLLNAGPEMLPAGLPVAFFARDTLAGVVTTTRSLAPSATLSLALDWQPSETNDWEFSLQPGAGGNEVGAEAVLCRTPDSARFTLAQAALLLYPGWNLVSSPVEPSNPAIASVQRPIAGTYAAIFGYAKAPLWYYPSGPDHGSLESIHAGLGYWIKETAAAPVPQPGDDPGEQPAVKLSLAGQRPPQDGPLPLLAGWNLAGYLPQASLPVTGALQSIDGAYASVLGFSGTALSFYPDLAPEYNTLWRLAPGSGYWISATHAVTLHYPAASITIDRRPERDECLPPAPGCHPGRGGRRRGAAHLCLGQPLRPGLPARRQPGPRQQHDHRPG